MPDKFFNVSIQHIPDLPTPFQLRIEYKGSKDFFKWLVDIAEQEGMLFTRRKLFFPINILHQNKYLYQVDRPTSKKSKHQQWRISDLILNKTDSIIIESKNDAYEIQKSLDFFLNYFAREQEKEYRLSLNLS